MTWLQIDPAAHRTIAATIAAGLGGLWWWASRAGQRAAAAAWRDGQDITAGLAMLVAVDTTQDAPPWRTAPTPTGDHCPRCGGRRCRPHREGRDCGLDGIAEATAYAASHPLAREGRHSGAASILRWLVGDWTTTDMPIGLRRQLGRLAGLARVPQVVEVAPHRMPYGARPVGWAMAAIEVRP